jgi:predicted dehydrogenase
MNVGILGCGGIAHKMAKTLTLMTKAKEDIHLVACGSRHLEKAQEFAKHFKIPKAYGSYEELVKDPEIDLIYVATPHSEHYKNTMLCLQNGKNVLCEKALTTDASLARSMFAEAEKRGLLLTEAIWTRYMPSRKMIQDILDKGMIGKPVHVTANLCYLISGHPRLVDPNLAGGSLLDVGIYPLNFTCMFFSPDYQSVSAHCTYTDKHLDETDHYHLEYANGLTADLDAGMVSLSNRKGVIEGTEGRMEVTNINDPEKIVVFDAKGKNVLVEKVPKQLTGYEYEVRECQEAIDKHATECPSMPHADSIRMMEVMDEIRAKLGVVYPFEQKKA